MSEIDAMIARQAAWQATRRRLPWPVKIRMAEMLRDAVRQLRSESSGGGRQASVKASRVAPSGRGGE